MRHLIVSALAALLLASGVTLADQGAPQSAVAIAEDLLAADRGFSAASAKTDLVSGLAGMFSEDVVMAIPGPTFARGRAAAVAALRGNPANPTSRGEWTPVRAGLSADGLHGFTFGYITIRRADDSIVAGKYVAYWVKGQDGWRVAAYKRVPSPEVSPTPVLMPPVLPDLMVAPSQDSAALESHRASLVAAERAFSDDAQVIGLGKAFAKHGSADSVNVNAGRPGFTVSSEAIGRNVEAFRPGPGSPATWGTTIAIVASSGDLGVSLGTSFTNGPDGKPGPTPTQTFFTIWRRASPSAPWRHIVE